MAQAIRQHNNWPTYFTPLGMTSIVFGLLMLVSGAAVLFGGFHMPGGEIPLLMPWINFISGAIYLIAGIGIVRRDFWSGSFNMTVAGLVVLVFSAYAWSVSKDISYGPAIWVASAAPVTGDVSVGHTYLSAVRPHMNA